MEAGRRVFAAGQAGRNTVPGPESRIPRVLAVHKIPSKWITEIL